MLGSEVWRPLCCSVLGNTFVYSQSGERVVISVLHAGLRVVICERQGRNSALEGRNQCPPRGFEGRNFRVAGS